MKKWLVKKKSYYKLYIDMTGNDILKEFKHIGELHLFRALLKNMNKETYQWFSTKDTRKEISNELGLSEATISNYLINLIQYKVLKKLNRGCYEINRKFIELESLK